MLLQVGREFKPVLHNKRMMPKACYSNAYRTVMKDPDRYVYVEGYGLHMLPCEHAWVWDRQDEKTIELTWPDLGSEYVGIPIRFDHVVPAVIASGCVLGDYKRRWPLFTMKPEEYVEDIG